MNLLHAIVLGILQGLTEFIPVSSTGHFFAIPALFGWPKPTLVFNVALHLGTLAALLAFFWRDIYRIIAGFAKHIIKGEPYGKNGADAEGQLFVPLIVATIPAAIIGALFNDKIESKLTEWYYIAGALVVVGVIMVLAEKVSRKQRGMERMNYTDYIAIGCAQACALFPGVSRSGATITAGLFRNLDRSAAARFSFLLSTPAILGAALLEFKKHILKTGIPAGEGLPFIVGIIASAIMGYLAIGFLMSYLRNKSLNAFAIYRFAFAIFMIAVFALKIKL